MKEFFNKYEDTINIYRHEVQEAIFREELEDIRFDLGGLSNEIEDHCDLTDEEKAELDEVINDLIDKIDFEIDLIKKAREEDEDEDEDED